MVEALQPDEDDVSIADAKPLPWRERHTKIRFLWYIAYYYCFCSKYAITMLLSEAEYHGA
jgi:hypothetical protein